MSAQSERDELIAAIVESPEDDAPRLVYADWLLAAGDRYGELIVASLEYAQRPEDLALKRRVAGLISAHKSAVLGGLPVSKPAFHRGFVDAAQINAKAFLELGPTLFERLPLLRELIIWLERGRAPAKLCSSPAFADLSRLRLRFGHELRLPKLANNPSVSGLELLELTGCAVTLEDCEALAASPYLGSLRTLELGSDAIGTQGVRALGKAAFAPRLRRLRLYEARLGPGGTRALAPFTSLQRLELDHDELDLPALEWLAELAPTLRELSVRGDRLGPGAVAALAPLKLRALDLEGVRIGDAGIAELAKLDLSSLEVLVLSANDLTRKAATRLAGLPMPKLRRLALRHNEMGRCARVFAAKLTHTRVELDEKVLPAGR